MTGVTVLPNTGFAPTNQAIADHLVEQAEWIVAGEYGDVATVVLLIEDTDGNLARQVCGRPCDLARITGLLTIAATRGALEG